MKITGLSHLFKWENLHNWWLTKYFFAPLYIRNARYWIFANIRYADIFLLILGRYRCISFLFGNNNKSLLCRNYKQNIFLFGLVFKKTLFIRIKYKIIKVFLTVH